MKHTLTDVRLKRLMLRSWRRGMKEMDIILGNYANAYLATMDTATLDLYEAMIEENDQLLYQWIIKIGDDAPKDYHELFKNIRDFHKIA